MRALPREEDLARELMLALHEDGVHPIGGGGSSHRDVIGKKEGMSRPKACAAIRATPAQCRLLLCASAPARQTPTPKAINNRS
jgi:hypothetical protein